MPLRAETKKIQSTLAQYGKTGVDVHLEGLTPGRIKHYRRLIFNIINNSLSQAYPIAKKLLTNKEWRSTVHNYFSTYKNQEPQIWRMPYEFSAYMIQSSSPLLTKYPFLLDLLWYEWIEIELFAMEDGLFPKITEPNNWLDQPIVVTPEHVLRILNWPVHIKNAKQITLEDEGTYYFLGFRHPKSLSVQFHDLTPFHAFLIEQLAKADYTLPYIINAAAELFQSSTDKLEKNAMRFLDIMREKGFVLGVEV